MVGLAAGGLVFATRREPSAPAAGGATAAAPSTRAPAAATPTTRAPAATATAPAIRAVQRDVAELRDLEFERRVPVTVESPDKLAKRLLRALAEETDEDELRRQGRAMELLGELPPAPTCPASSTGSRPRACSASTCRADRPRAACTSAPAAASTPTPGSSWPTS